MILEILRPLEPMCSNMHDFVWSMYMCKEYSLRVSKSINYEYVSHDKLQISNMEYREIVSGRLNCACHASLKQHVVLWWAHWFGTLIVSVIHFHQLSDHMQKAIPCSRMDSSPTILCSNRKMLVCLYVRWQEEREVMGGMSRHGQRMVLLLGVRPQ